MRMSTKGRYGLRAVLQIAAARGSAVSVGRISYEQEISDGYLEQLMRKLKNAGIVTSTRGAKGGYILAKDPKDVSVADVLKAVGESVEPVECTELKGGGMCPTSGTCKAKRAWQRLNDGVRNITESMTIEYLIKDEEPAGSGKENLYG